MSYAAQASRLVWVAMFAWWMAPASAEPLKVCTGGDRAERKVTCLVDGDTGWEVGIKWRLVDIDTPEYAAQAECKQEVEFAKAATYRMLELMGAGYRIDWLGEQTRGGDRELVRVTLADGRDAGEVLLREGHAVRWPHSPGVWCEH